MGERESRKKVLPAQAHLYRLFERCRRFARTGHKGFDQGPILNDVGADDVLKGTVATSEGDGERRKNSSCPFDPLGDSSTHTYCWSGVTATSTGVAPSAMVGAVAMLPRAPYSSVGGLPEASETPAEYTRPSVACAAPATPSNCESVMYAPPLSDCRTG